MALTHTTATRNALADLIDTLTNTGGGANGTLEFQTAASGLVATLALSAAAFGAAAAGVITAAAISDDTDADGSASPVTKFIWKDKDGTEVFQGTVTVTAGGGDIELSAVVIGAGSTVSMTSFTYTASL